MKNSEKIFEILISSKKVAIFSHKNPDSDAFGSAFAMKQMLLELGKKAEVFSYGTCESFLTDLFPAKELKNNFKSKNYDTVVLVDLNTWDRLDDEFVEEVKKAKNVVLFDHHRGGDLPYENMLVNTDSAACCQILTKFMKKHKLPISKKTATYLWAGLMGDTGRFLHSNLTAETLEVGKILFVAGADTQFVYEKMYRSNSASDIKLQYEFLKHTTFFFDRTVGMTIFTNKDLKKLKIDRENVKKYTNLIINLKDSKLSFLATETEKGLFKVSMRTKGANSQPFASQMGGGGHACASGFEIKTTKKALLKRAADWAKEILNG